MFEDLSSKDWLFVLGAMALGFGLVRFLLSKLSGKPGGVSGTDHAETAPPPVTEPPHCETAPPPVTELPPHWHQVLGVDPTACEAEIRTAYRRKIAQYHPDRVANLGQEFIAMAEMRAKEINQALAAALAR